MDNSCDIGNGRDWCLFFALFCFGRSFGFTIEQIPAAVRAVGWYLFLPFAFSSVWWWK